MLDALYVGGCTRLFGVVDRSIGRGGVPGIPTLPALYIFPMTNLQPTTFNLQPPNHNPHTIRPSRTSRQEKRHQREREHVQRYHGRRDHGQSVCHYDTMARLATGLCSFCSHLWVGVSCRAVWSILYHTISCRACWVYDIVSYIAYMSYCPYHSYHRYRPYYSCHIIPYISYISYYTMLYHIISYISNISYYTLYTSSINQPTNQSINQPVNQSRGRYSSTLAFTNFKSSQVNSSQVNST